MDPPPTVTEVMRQYAFVLDAIGEYGDRLTQDGLFGESLERLMERFSELRNEVKQLFTLAVFAAAEAAIRAHFSTAATTGNPGHYAQQAKALSQLHNDRVALDDILNIWKEWPGTPPNFGDTVGRLVQVMKRRDWLAHGRYWTDESGVPNADPDHVYGVLQEIKSGAPDFPCP